jgi:HK97 family phage major capsid protein
LQTRVAHDTSDLPSPDKPIEGRHDIRAWYAQRKDYARYEGSPAVTKDWDSFDKNSFYRALHTGNRDNREYRAMAEGSQSFSVTGGTGGYITPIQFSMDVLPLLRAALLFTNETDDGAIGGPMVYDMTGPTETAPTWSSDGGATMTQWLAENAQMTPTQPALGLGLLTAKTMAVIVLASRQLIADVGEGVDFAQLVESNIAMAVARGLDNAALWGTGPAQFQPAGLLTASGAPGSPLKRSNAGQRRARVSQADGLFRFVTSANVGRRSKELRLNGDPSWRLSGYPSGDLYGHQWRCP